MSFGSLGRDDEMKVRRKYRLWWPTQLSVTEPASSVLLFGWIVSSSSTSVDIIVAFACNEVSLSSVHSDLQENLHKTNNSLSVALQDKCTFSLLGRCAVDLSSNGQLVANRVEEDRQINSEHSNVRAESNECMLDDKYEVWRCGCCKLDGLLDNYRLVSMKKNYWLQLVCGSWGNVNRKIKWIPKLHHIHLNGKTVLHFDLHVILYDTPTFGSHHFSVGFWSSEQVKTTLRKPRWVEELHEKKLPLDLDAVVLAINSASAAKLFFERHVGFERLNIQFPIVFLCINWIWKLLAMSIASISTCFYLLFLLFNFHLSLGLLSWMHILLEKIFSNTLKNVKIRRCQVLYWPILLKDNGLRSWSCVEYAEKAALHKHSMWSSMAIDLLLGYFVGVALFFHAESACLCVSKFADDITNDLLRTGCVWLMGVPAGFKLNTELAEVLGMISLNAIQIWSTLWFFMGSLFIYIVKGLAVSAVLFGVTTPAALIIDIFLLATAHVSTLHWLVSNIYSQQIQAIAALWRLFRGRKWNPLRHRYDSYDYNVEQHVVGSLLFTPLLLLLPTTSVFYIFFTLMRSSISFVRTTIDIIISIIHATPHIKILLWLVRPRRFPSGIWFEIVHSQTDAVQPSDVGCSSNACAPSENSWLGADMCGNQPSVLVCFLRSNFLNIGQIVWPHYRYIFSVVSGSIVASSAYGVLTGKSIPSTLGTGFASTMPWRYIPYKEYWHICYEAVILCKGDVH
ncbi:Phosphatidylinositol N-acetylglucosaminyltransferase [Bertholletia excelsa]